MEQQVKRPRSSNGLGYLRNERKAVWLELLEEGVG